MRLHLKIIGMILIYCASIAGCQSYLSKNKSSEKQSSDSSTANQQLENLPNQITIFIGRGVCCSGHIISVGKNGDFKYVVGEYVLPENSDGISTDSMPEVYDPQLIKINQKYNQKNGKISEENFRQLEKLLSNTKSLEFHDKTVIKDDYLYHLYLDGKKIAYGYQVNMKSFPENLRKIIELISGDVKLYELPGMA